MAMAKEINYQELSAELDAVLLKLQSDDVSVNEALKLYERGMEITTQLEKYLQDAQNKVTKIRASLES